MKTLPLPTHVKLVDIRERMPELAQGAEPAVTARGLQLLRRAIWFILLVLLPTAVTALYYGLWAADRYVSEIKIVVRSPSFTPQVSLGGTSQPSIAAPARATDDAHSINAFMASRDALAQLVAKAGLREIYASPKADMLSRFPRPLGSSSDEALFKYYESMVKVDFDKTTNITTVEIQAFEPQDAVRVATVLLESAEALANRMTARMREDLVRTATEEVERSRARSLAAQAAITAFRNRESIVDPTRFSTALVETVARLSFELAQTRAQLSEVQRASPQSPQVGVLATRIAAFEQQIAIERRNLAGSAGSLAPKIAEYEQLQLEREFSEKLLASAVSALEMARMDAQRQQIYVERIVAPQAADYPLYPRRLLIIAATFAVLTLVYWVLSVLVGNIRKHAPV